MSLTTAELISNATFFWCHSTRSVGVGTSVLVFQDLIHCFLDTTHLAMNTANDDDEYKNAKADDAPPTPLGRDSLTYPVFAAMGRRYSSSSSQSSSSSSWKLGC